MLSHFYFLSKYLMLKMFCLVILPALMLAKVLLLAKSSQYFFLCLIFLWTSFSFCKFSCLCWGSLIWFIPDCFYDFTIKPFTSTFVLNLSKCIFGGNAFILINWILLKWCKRNMFMTIWINGYVELIVWICWINCDYFPGYVQLFFGTKDNLMIRSSCLLHNAIFIGICWHVNVKFRFAVTPVGNFIVCFNPKVLENCNYFLDSDEILSVWFIMYCHFSEHCTIFLPVYIHNS